MLSSHSEILAEIINTKILTKITQIPRIPTLILHIPTYILHIPSIRTLFPVNPTLILRIPTLIPCILTPNPRIPTLFCYIPALIPRIPNILTPHSPHSHPDSLYSPLDSLRFHPDLSRSHHFPHSFSRLLISAFTDSQILTGF